MSLCNQRCDSNKFYKGFIHSGSTETIDFCRLENYRQWDWGAACFGGDKSPLKENWVARVNMMAEPLPLAALKKVEDEIK